MRRKKLTKIAQWGISFFFFFLSTRSLLFILKIKCVHANPKLPVYPYPHLPCLVTISSFSKSVSLFLFCKWIPLYNFFFRFHIHMISYDICLPLSYLIHLFFFFWKPPHQHTQSIYSNLEIAKQMCLKLLSLFNTHPCLWLGKWPSHTATKLCSGLPLYPQPGMPPPFHLFS